MANNEELKRYLTERLTDLDPSLSDSAGSLMYVKVINPLLVRLGTDPLSVDIETFILSRLQDEFPALDVKSPGSVLRDVLVSPLVLILEPLQREIEFLRTQNSLADSESLTESEMDALLSNVLSERKFGEYARGYVRVYFNAARAVGVDASIVFSTAGGNGFVAEEAFTYAVTDMVRSGNQFYLDIPVRSQQPTTDGNIGSGAIKYVSGLEGVVRVTNLTAFTGGVTKETNEDFLIRAERSLSERSLNTKRGIETAILNSFTDVVSVQIVGYGEPDMNRDIIQARVKEEFDEDIGPLIYMTANWRTHGLRPGAGVVLPFTNTLAIVAPDESAIDGGWPEELLLSLLQAKYIRVSDGSGLTWSHTGDEPPYGDSDGGPAGVDPYKKNTYEDGLLHRVRAVDETFYNAAGDHEVYIRLKDFEVYPEPVDIMSPVGIPATITSSEPDVGLNKRSYQGSAFKMIGEIDSGGVLHDIVLGAHLPFADYVYTTFVGTQIPPAIVPGRDFLYTWTEDKSWSINFNGDDLGLTYPKKARLWPLKTYYSNSELGVGRIDSFMVSKGRAVYPGKDQYVFDPSLVFSLMRENIKIVDYGSPKFTTTDDIVERFGGQETEEVGRGPGVMIQVMEDLTSHTPETETWANLQAAHPLQVDLILHASQPKWADRGVSEGHYVCCSIYRHDTAGIFDGKLANVETDIQWQGWGRVIKVGAGTPWRLRVEGLDFGPLHENNFCNFSPANSGIVTINAVPQEFYNGLGQGALFDTTMIRMEYDAAFAVLDPRQPWQADPFAPAEPGSGNHATKELLVTDPLLLPPTPWGPNKPGMKLEIINPIADANPFFVDDSLATYPSLPQMFAGIIAKLATHTSLQDFANNPILSATVNGAGNGLIFKCEVHGEYGNSIQIVEWTQDGSPCGQSGNLADGVAPSITQLANYLAGRYSVAFAAADAEVLTNAGEEPAKIRIFQNDNSLAPVYYNIESSTIPSDFDLSNWNGDQFLAGGFHYGFGPLIQVGYDAHLFPIIFGVPGTAPNLIAGDPVTYEHEELTPAPAIDGVTLTYSLSTENTPLHRGTLRLHYWDPEDRDGVPADGQHYVWNDDGEGRLTQIHPAWLDGVGNPTAVITDAVNLALEIEETSPGSGVYHEKGRIDYSQGRISLEFNQAHVPLVENLVAVGGHEFPLFSVGYDYYYNPFKAAWTVYRGAVETIAPTGDLGVSYDEFSFVPAYKRPGPRGTLSSLVGPDQDGSVIARGSSVFHSDRWDGDPGNDLGSTYRYSETTERQNKRRGLWIRLGKGFDQKHPSIGGAPSAKCVSGEVVDFDSSGPEAQVASTWPSGVYTVADQRKYPKTRYAIQTGHDIDHDAVDEDFFVTKLSLPTVPGSRNLDHPEDPTEMSFSGEEMTYINSKGLSGFLLPHPMGPSHYGTTDFPYGGAPPNSVVDNHLLDHQVLQVYDAATDSLEDAGIVVSGIPGGVPFPGWFGGEFEIKDDEIHIGGMTDVYSKSTAVEERTTAPIKLQPEALDPDALPAPSPTDPPPEYEVLVSAADGIINATMAGDATHFDSAELLAAIALHFGATGIALDNLVIEILDPPTPDLQPIFFRAIHTTSAGVKVDGEFPDGASYANVRFRALFGCTTSVDKPLIVLQQGNDLVVEKNDLSVFCPSGFSFGTDPGDVAIYISIDSTTSRGEYRVLSKNLNTLIIETAIPETGTALSYRVYTKQAAGVALPLVRVKSVSLSGSETEGVVVPYKNPVDIVASSFAGLNDDPINEESIGEDPTAFEWEPTVMIQPFGPGGENRACLVVHDNEDFVTEHNIIKYDVVRIETLEEPNKHFYVEDIRDVDTGNTTGKRNCLVLDRNLVGSTSDVVNVRFSLGRPAVGTAELVFRDPTFFEAGPDTEFSYTLDLGTVAGQTFGNQRTYKFRPSPLESAVLFLSDYAFSDITIDGNDPGFLVSEDINFFKHGLKVGDRITILTRVIRSGLFNGQDPFLEDENLALAGKTLVVSVNGQRRTVVFSGPNPTTLEQAVADINRQLGDVLKAEIWEDPANAEHYYLQISSNTPIQLLTEGTIGILDELRCVGLDQQDNNHYDPVLLNTELFDPYYIDDIIYVDKNTALDGKAKWKLKVLSVDGNNDTPVTAGTMETVFIEARRYKYQRVMPADMTQTAVGLYSAPITLTSYDPNVTDGLISEQTQLSVAGHKSLGYEMVVKNANYSYSLGEECSIRTTSVILSDTQKDFSKPYALPGADVTVTYDRSQSVADIQSYLLNKAMRVVCNNPLSKHFFPAYPMTGLSYGDSRLSPTEVRTYLEEFFKTLYPNKPLELYDISALLAKRGVGYVQFPQYVAFLVHDENRVVRIVRSEDVIYLNKRFHIMEDTTGVVINKVR